MESSPTDSDRKDPPSSKQRGLFVAIVSERTDGQEMCSISPWPTSDQDLLSEWVAVREESFVSLEEMR